MDLRNEVGRFRVSDVFGILLVAVLLFGLSLSIAL